MRKTITQTESLGRYAGAVDGAIAEIQKIDAVSRIWSKDASLWKSDASHQKIISNALGWLTVARMMEGRVGEIGQFATEVRDAGFKHMVLLGMGGSSLCPEVFRRTFGPKAGYPELIVLDSTVPETIRTVESRIDLESTLFIVASKSGSTIEPRTLFEYFFDRVKQQKGDDAGQNFIAVTDPGTMLGGVASDRRFRRTFVNPADIGGRFSALSFFGMVPAGLAGYDIKGILESAITSIEECEKKQAADNPGVRLGAIMGALQKQGRDKLTLVITPPVDSLGLWIEQLVAESTGKEGVGILPVAGEPLGSPNDYGDDRVFVYIHTGEATSDVESRLQALEAAGHPVVRRVLGDEVDLGGEFFAWEFATAVAGQIMGINPFDQPNVQESKDNTGKLLKAYQSEGSLPEQQPVADQNGIRIYAGKAAGPFDDRSLQGVIKAHLATVKPGDYVAFTAYIEETAATEQAFEMLRARVRDTRKVATTLGYGPRFLHSTGQLHKGGAGNGVFIQVTADSSEGIDIPGEPYSFSVLKQAQAIGDFESLANRDRRVIRFHVGTDVNAGLSKLVELVEQATR